MPDDPKVPRSVPLSSVQAIADWCPGSDPFNVSTVPLRRRPSLNALHSTRHEDKMEMLACHDNGGAVYKEDALIQGNNDGKQIYTLRYFHHVDIFIYFSHARLTIPPAAWTNASHRNGVKMIGTYISEWDDGRPDTLKLLYGKDFDPTKPGFSDNERFEGQFNPYFANKLVEIAEYFKFDGWFFNIEHDFKTSVDASNMLWFLRYITDKMHERIPNSLVLWYDSVTVSGDLRWQNRVSDHNLPFLLVTDGIFLNYGWAEEYPQASVTLARRAIDGVQLNPTTRRIMSVQNALSWHDAREAVRRDIMERQKREVPPEVIERERPKLGESEVEKREREQRIRERLWREFVAREAEVEHVVGEGSWFTETNEPRSGPPASRRVWVGTDVFGRGTFGGGGFNCHKAHRVIRKAKANAALFAQSWTYERAQDSPQQYPTTFDNMDRRFWVDPAHRAGEGDRGVGRPLEWIKDQTGVDGTDIGAVSSNVAPRRAAGGDSKYDEASLSPNEWFFTNFDRGFGAGYYIDGKLVSSSPWSHIGRQNIQPTYLNASHRHYRTLDTTTGRFSRVSHLEKHVGLRATKVDVVTSEPAHHSSSIVGITLKQRPNGNNSAVEIELLELCVDVTVNTHLRVVYRTDANVMVGVSFVFVVRKVHTERFMVFSENTVGVLETGWSTLDVELLPLLSTGTQSSEVALVKLGIVVANRNEGKTDGSDTIRVFSPDDSLYEGGRGLTEQSFIDKNEPETSGSTVQLSIGAVRISNLDPSGHPARLRSMAFSDVFRVPPTPETESTLCYATAIWPHDDTSSSGSLQTAFWEMYVGGDWVGTAYVERYRFGVSREKVGDGGVRVEAVGYDELGLKTGDVCTGLFTL